jgi:hypothetical protein
MLAKSTVKASQFAHSVSSLWTEFFSEIWLAVHFWWSLSPLDVRLVACLAGLGGSKCRFRVSQCLSSMFQIFGALRLLMWPAMGQMIIDISL